MTDKNNEQFSACHLWDMKNLVVDKNDRMLISKML